MKLKNNLTNWEITEICKKNNISLKYCSYKDKLTKLTNGNYIINLDNYPNKGTHWVALNVRNKNHCYFDSYGTPPPNKLTKLIKNKYKYVVYNGNQIQDNESLKCGYFCIVFLHFVSNLKDNANYNNKINNFLLNFWLGDEKQNDKQIINYFKAFNIII